MKIAILGGLGFIGTNLYNELSKTNKVIILDNFEIKNNLKYHKSSKIYKCDILKLNNIIKHTKNIDIIINLAAQTGVLESNIFPEKSINLNILGTLNVLKACKANKIKHFINASTAGAIYGNTTFANEKSLTKPLSFYGLTKKFSEDQIKIFLNPTNIKNTNLRFSNVYGPYSLHKKSLIHNSIKNSIKNKIQFIYGNGNQTRDFIYVKDLVKIILIICKKKISGTYNIASGSSYKVNYILKTLSKKNKKFNFKKIAKKSGEVERVKLNNSKLLKKLKINKNFFIKLDQGIIETYKWYDKNLIN